MGHPAHQAPQVRLAPQVQREHAENLANAAPRALWGRQALRLKASRANGVKPGPLGRRGLKATPAPVARLVILVRKDLEAKSAQPAPMDPRGTLETTETRGTLGRRERRGRRVRKVTLGRLAPLGQ